MYILDNNKITKIEETTFKELGMKESHVEELLRRNVEMLCNEEDSMLIVGQQVTNESSGRSDLTAIDNEGNIVLIEIKRDKKDIEHRKEAFEFQAIRYAASFATIHSIEEFIQNINKLHSLNIFYEVVKQVLFISIIQIFLKEIIFRAKTLILNNVLF